MKRINISKCSILAILVLMCLIFCSMAMADPFTRKTHEWTADQKFKKDIIVGKTLKNRTILQGEDGTIEIRNSDNEVTFALGTDGKQELYGWKKNIIVIDTEAELKAGSGNSIYNVWLVDTSLKDMNKDSLHSGVSLYLPSGTTAMDGFPLTIVDISLTGSTDILIVPANDAVQVSGVTDAINGYVCIDSVAGVTQSSESADVFMYNVLDNYGEAVTYIYDWVVATNGGTWYQVSGVTTD